MITAEDLQQAFRKLCEVCRVFVEFACQVWEKIKEISRKCELYRKKRPIYGYVQHKVMRSQVLNRKPKLIRARTTC